MNTVQIGPGDNQEVGIQSYLDNTTGAKGAFELECAAGYVRQHPVTGNKDVWITGDRKKVAAFEWYCGDESSEGFNKWFLRDKNSDYVVTHEGGRIKGAIGYVTLTVKKA